MRGLAAMSVIGIKHTCGILPHESVPKSFGAELIGKGFFVHTRFQSYSDGIRGGSSDCALAHRVCIAKIKRRLLSVRNQHFYTMELY
jgi:hypothetical protein